MLPFSRDQFIATFVAQNAAMWPLQIGAYALGLLMVWALSRPTLTRLERALITGGLASMWLATGIGYHAVQFASINPAAWGFAALFVVQAALLLAEGALRSQPMFEPRRARWSWIGWGLVL